MAKNTISAADDLLTIATPEQAQTETSLQDTGMSIQFSPDTLLGETLPMMGKGMLGIFIVIGFIICVVYLLNRLFKPRESQTDK